MNVALQVLGHPGLHVTVFDPDIITEANIGRQLFSETELGQCKATAAVTRVNRFFGTTWTAENCRYPVRKTQENGDKAGEYHHHLHGQYPLTTGTVEIPEKIQGGLRKQ